MAEGVGTVDHEGVGAYRRGDAAGRTRPETAMRGT